MVTAVSTTRRVLARRVDQGEYFFIANSVACSKSAPVMQSWIPKPQAQVQLTDLLTIFEIFFLFVNMYGVRLPVISCYMCAKTEVSQEQKHCSCKCTPDRIDGT